MSIETPRRVVRLARADVTFEVFDDEAVLINFKTGSYFSVGGAGREVIEALVGGDRTLEELVDAIEARYAAETGVVAGAVSTFLTALEDAGLATMTDTDAGPVAHVAGVGAPSPTPNLRRPFEPPVLSAFDDMQALLLLDPIHEVDETGWPNVKPASSDTHE
jgi:hypothetical protein